MRPSTGSSGDSGCLSETAQIHALLPLGHSLLSPSGLRVLEPTSKCCGLALLGAQFHSQCCTETKLSGAKPLPLRFPQPTGNETQQACGSADRHGKTSYPREKMVSPWCSSRAVNLGSSFPLP